MRAIDIEHALVIRRNFALISARLVAGGRHEFTHAGFAWAATHRWFHHYAASIFGRSYILPASGMASPPWEGMPPLFTLEL